MSSSRLDQRGVFHLPMGIALAVFMTAAIALLGFRLRWRQLCERQLRLDRCVAGTARSAVEALDAISSDNARIRALRAAILAATLQPELIPELRTALEAVVAHQEIERVRLAAELLGGIPRRGCARPGDLPMPAAGAVWTRDPPDPLGPGVLRWSAGRPRRLRLGVLNPPRFSAAELEGDSDATPRSWHARWAGID